MNIIERDNIFMYIYFTINLNVYYSYDDVNVHKSTNLFYSFYLIVHII